MMALLRNRQLEIMHKRNILRGDVSASDAEVARARDCVRENVQERGWKIHRVGYHNGDYCVAIYVDLESRTPRLAEPVELGCGVGVTWDAALARALDQAFASGEW